MRTRLSLVTFQHPFTLNRDVGELPPGSYEIETDEEEMQTMDRTVYRKVAIHLHVKRRGSTRTITVKPADLQAALERDLSP